VAATLLALAAAYAVPRATEMLLGLDDLSRIAHHWLNNSAAEREIEAALAANDADLAQSFVDLSSDCQVTLNPSLVEKVNIATADAATTRHAAKSFARGLITGESDDMAALAGTVIGDLLVFGDIRDTLREGTRLAVGQKADELVLGLASAGIAITAATYVTFGAVGPVRAGFSLMKIARKTRSLGAELAESLGRMVRQAGLSEPAMAVRAGHQATKVERASGLLNFARDVGRVEKAAGGRAVFDGLKISKEPRDMRRVAKLAEKEGSRTRAILKLAGRGAIMLAVFALDASLWLLGALFAVFGFISALKSATERITLRILRRRKERHKLKQVQLIAAAPARS
jgi:hypothetical protein